jgi:hypothetical protein
VTDIPEPITTVKKVRRLIAQVTGVKPIWNPFSRRHGGIE